VWLGFTPLFPNEVRVRWGKNDGDDGKNNPPICPVKNCGEPVKGNNGGDIFGRGEDMPVPLVLVLPLSLMEFEEEEREMDE
jgi:hypothetical protein